MSEARADILGAGDACPRRAALQHEEIPEALAGHRQAPPPAPIAADDPLEAFRQRLLLNHCSAWRNGRTRSDAVQEYFTLRVRGLRTRARLVAGNDSRLAAMPWRDGGVLARFGAATAEDPVSISYAQLGIAESGSLVLFANRGNPAANNWLVQDHIVLLDLADLVPDFERGWQKIRELLTRCDPPRGINFISGPSSTADIKGHLVFGAHGPQRLHVILVGQAPALP